MRVRVDECPDAGERELISQAPEQLERGQVRKPLSLVSAATCYRAPHRNEDTWPEALVIE